MKSPYLTEHNRLPDVIAAIQVMSTYKFYKLDFADWSDRISGSEQNEAHWKRVFIEHPEFFRLDSGREKASLVWRRQHPKRYDVDTAQVISREEFELRKNDASRLSRSPLGPDEIANLVSTAINLHSRALERQKDFRWWVPVISSFVGAVIGSALSALGG